MTKYDVYHRLTAKRVVDFVLALIELFLLGFTADRKSAICKTRVDHHPPNFRIERDVPANHFWMDS